MLHSLAGKGRKVNIEKIVSEIILVGLGAVISTTCWLTVQCVKEIMEEKKDLKMTHVEAPEE